MVEAGVGKVGLNKNRAQNFGPIEVFTRQLATPALAGNRYCAMRVIVTRARAAADQQKQRGEHMEIKCLHHG